MTEMTKTGQHLLRALVEAALAEDIGPGDLTSMACLEPNPVTGRIVAKSAGILSGERAALTVFELVDSANRIDFFLHDGDLFSEGEMVAKIEGFNQTILTAERVALNFLAHLSGVASLTREFADRIRSVSKKCKLLDTRKTTPGWRQLEKAAVIHGGGHNHRMGLYDMILIKENHITTAGSIRAAIDSAREFLKTADFRLQFKRKAEEIETLVEVGNESQVREALSAGVNRLLLDNQSPESLTKLVSLARGLKDDLILEASGNVTLLNVAEIASTGVDFISIGSLTHSAPAADFSLLFDVAAS